MLTLLIQRTHIWKALLCTHYLKFCLDLHAAIAYVNEARCGCQHIGLASTDDIRAVTISLSLSFLYDWSPQAPLVWIFIKSTIGDCGLQRPHCAVWYLNFLLSLTQSFSVTLPSPPFSPLAITGLHSGWLVLLSLSQCKNTQYLS